MRVAKDETTFPASHLPEDPAPPKSLPERWLQHGGAFLRSAFGISCALGVCLSLCLTALLSLNGLSVGAIVESGVSVQDVFAPYEMQVEDRNATQQRWALARASIAPIYRPADEINATLRDNLLVIFQQFHAIAGNRKLSPAERRELFYDVVGGESAESALVYHRLFAPQADPVEWDRLQALTLQTTDRILKRGLSTTDFFNHKQEVIEKALASHGDLSVAEADTLRFLVSTVLSQPNRVLDEAAMAKAQQEAIRQVKPKVRVYQKGEKIVGRGDVLTPLQSDALQQMGRSVKGLSWSACLGIFFLCAFAVTTLWVYIFSYEDHRFYRPRYLALVASLILGTVVLLKVAVENQLPITGFPLAAFALTLSIFTHPRIAVLATSLLVFLVGLTLNVALPDLAVLLFGSTVGVFILSQRLNFTDREQVMLSGLYVGLTNAVVILGIYLLNPPPVWGNDGSDLLHVAGWGLLLSGIFSGVLTFGLLPWLERLFQLVTPYTLMELGNHDKPLLKRMQFEAPGTFHHSLMVASLAEAAAEAIGANGLLTRVGSLYHDIGKMRRPLFFIENQAYFGVDNPHDKLTPRLSKMVVTAHPRDSVEMARQHRLPEVLVKFMREHHGTLTAGYFYNQACLQEGEENVNKSQFRYPGPKPTMRETAIVMLADACESAVRALKNPTVAQIEERIDKIIRQRVDDGQFDNCPLTFRDLHLIKETFVRVLRGIQHNRIEYQQNVMKELGRKLQRVPESHPLPELDKLSLEESSVTELPPNEAPGA